MGWITYIKKIKILRAKYNNFTKWTWSFNLSLPESINCKYRLRVGYLLDERVCDGADTQNIIGIRAANIEELRVWRLRHFSDFQTLTQDFIVTVDL